MKTHAHRGHSYAWILDHTDIQRQVGCRFCGVERRWHNSKTEWRPRDGGDWSLTWIPCTRRPSDGNPEDEVSL